MLLSRFNCLSKILLLMTLSSFGYIINGKLFRSRIRIRAPPAKDIPTTSTLHKPISKLDGLEYSKFFNVKLYFKGSALPKYNRSKEMLLYNLDVKETNSAIKIANKKVGKTSADLSFVSFKTLISPLARPGRSHLNVHEENELQDRPPQETSQPQPGCSILELKAHESTPDIAISMLKDRELALDRPPLSVPRSRSSKAIVVYRDNKITISKNFSNPCKKGSDCGGECS